MLRNIINTGDAVDMEAGLLPDICLLVARILSGLLDLSSFSYFFFFFQAEDGIRDLTVTGVQTCALPILSGTEPTVVFSLRAISAPPSRPPTMTLIPFAPACIVASVRCLSTRRNEIGRASCRERV